MRELFVRNLAGEEFPLSKYTVKRNKSVENAARTISVEILLDVEENLQGYREIRNQTYLIFDGETYVAGNVKEVTSGRMAKKTMMAEHIFYQDMKLRNRKYTTLTGSKKPEELLSFVFIDSGYKVNYDPTGLPTTIEVENFGKNNLLALLQELMSRIGAEFDYLDKQVFVAAELGRVTDKQLRHEYNINNPSKEMDTTNLRTYIKGFSTQNADGSYYYVADYTSPLAEVYGILIADPLYDDKYKSSASLREACKQTLTDTIDFTIQLTATQLAEMDLRDVQKGDYLWCIIDPFDIDIRVRVVDIEDYEDENKDPVFTLGKVKRNASSIIHQYRNAVKTINAIYNPDTQKIKPTAIDTKNIAYPVASATQAGIVTAADYTKLEKLKTGEDGTVVIPLATVLNDGLLSAELFRKLNVLKVDQTGQVIIDFSAVDLSTNETIKNIMDRITTLENSSSS
ncbi:phage tail protein [Priestia megaterium]|uniref:phage tail protein n=1 Tax=Priestia megaterium TaxID=1404 RepID=UPI0030080573